MFEMRTSGESLILKSQFNTMNSKFQWEIVFHATPLPMLIVDEDVRVEEFNLAAGAFIGKDRLEIIGKRTGDMLLCVNSLKGSAGSGSSTECQDCVIRNGVKTAIHGKITQQVKTRLERMRGGKLEVDQVLVTVTPFKGENDQPWVLLILENITEVVKLRELLPVCVHCKKIRDDDEYWHEVDVYFTRHLDIDFSHGLCPDCLERTLKKLEIGELPKI